MKRHCIHQRLIALILTMLVLGVQLVNALSDSHSQVVHRHVDGSGQVSKAHGAHDHQQMLMRVEGSHGHVSEHDAGDHSHDLPLRTVLAVAQFSFMPIWYTEATLPFRSFIVHPLERPPKSSVWRHPPERWPLPAYFPQFI